MLIDLIGSLFRDIILMSRTDCPNTATNAYDAGWSKFSDFYPINYLITSFFYNLTDCFSYGNSFDRKIFSPSFFPIFKNRGPSIATHA